MDQTTISREGNFLDSKIGADCKFLVGANWGDIEEISGHKAIFSNASPVFEKMFFGSIPENGEDIKVPDIQPGIFHKIVNFFYTGNITIVSVEDAVGIWYAAEKYNIAELIKHIPDYLIKNVQPDNVCYTLKFAISFENEIVMKKCQEIIVAETAMVTSDLSFLEADLATLNFILDQEVLNDSEMELFKALVRYDDEQKRNICDVKSVTVDQPSTSSGTSRSGDLEGLPNQDDTDTEGGVKTNEGNPVKELVKKIRFLTMTPKEFVDCLEISSFLSISEAFNILVNISTPTAWGFPMPKGYSTRMTKREVKPEKFYCIHCKPIDYALKEVSTPIEFSLVFRTSTAIKITGVQVNYPAVIKDGYSCKRKLSHTIEITDKNKLNLIFSQNINLDLDLKDGFFKEITFDRPVQIDSRMWFIMRIKLHDKTFGHTFEYYNNHCCCNRYVVNDVQFLFDKQFNRYFVGCNCKGLIRSIVFTI